jgi:hypothetical protein
MPPPEPARANSHTERAWFAADDPVPALVMLVRGARSVIASTSDNWHTWRLRRRASYRPAASTTSPGDRSSPA